MVDRRDYVTHDECRSKHGRNKARLAWITAMLLVVLAAPCIATAIAWQARSKAEGVEIRLSVQGESIDKTLTTIQGDLRDFKTTVGADVRQIRETQIQMLRNGGD